jgi:PAS domain S-box-containing protein
MMNSAKAIDAVPPFFPIPQSLGTAVIIQDLEGRITYFNKAAEVYSGFTSAEVFGRRPWDFLISEEDAPILSQAFQDLTTTGIQVEMETTWITRSKEKRIMRWSNAPVLDECGETRWVVNTFVDITEDKESEGQLLKAKAELTRALQLRDDFLMIASHELRTPLTPLILQIQMMKKYLRKEMFVSGKDADQFLTLLNLSGAHIERLNKLISNLLDVSQIKAGRLELKREETNLSELVHGILDRYSEMAKSSGCSVRLDADVAVRGNWDRIRMEQVVVNLLINALKFGKGKSIEIRVWKEHTVAMLSVTDHGIGIPKEDQERLFHIFERVHSTPQYEGLGLGLYIAREIVQAHEGTLELESRPGRTVFTIEIPRAIRTVD